MFPSRLSLFTKSVPYRHLTFILFRIFLVFLNWFMGFEMIITSPRSSIRHIWRPPQGPCLGSESAKSFTQMPINKYASFELFDKHHIWIPDSRPWNLTPAVNFCVESKQNPSPRAQKEETSILFSRRKCPRWCIGHYSAPWSWRGTRIRGNDSNRLPGSPETIQDPWKI